MIEMSAQGVGQKAARGGKKEKAKETLSEGNAGW